jgi:hypothetical protein
MFETFDMPDTHESCARRATTVTPSQALTLLNNELTMDWARAMARRVTSDAGRPDAGSPGSQVDRAYRLAYARAPSGEERMAAVKFLERHDTITGDRKKSLDDLCHMLLNSNEFLYLN